MAMHTPGATGWLVVAMMLAGLMVLMMTAASWGAEVTYPVVDTGQTRVFNDRRQLTSPPKAGQPYYGQDGHYAGTQPNYHNNGDGTVSDLVTGLMWTQDPGSKVTYPQARAGAKTCRVGGHHDWRLPTIKELYSLIQFSGSQQAKIPYLPDVFEFTWGDVDGGRVMDSQFWSATANVGRAMFDDHTIFGVNFADGRIKAYPRDRGPSGPTKHFVLYVRGNEAYGENRFEDNGDGTVTDHATGLMWAKADSSKPMDWPAALAWCENLDLAGHDDWRLPNAKELQSIVDYSRAPDAKLASRRGPAIDPVFTVHDDESWAWTSTTHLDHGMASQGVYVAFGRAMSERTDRNGNKLNAHGAGAQRSDPKTGDPARYSDGRGPQGDEVRILNYVRAVRNVAPNAVQAVTPETSPSPAMQAGPPRNNEEPAHSPSHPTRFPPPPPPFRPAKPRR